MAINKKKGRQQLHEKDVCLVDDFVAHVCDPTVNISSVCCDFLHPKGNFLS